MSIPDSRPLAVDQPGNTGWFAVHTKYQHESVAASFLAFKGFEVFLPKYLSARRWSDRTRELSLPLFPCYLFLRKGFEHRLNVLTTPGVRGLVGFAGVPSVIPDAEVEAIRRLLTKDVCVEPHPFLKCGDWVRVKNGPLEGLEGIFVRTKSQARLVLSVNLLQKSAAVEVDVWSVERVPQPN